MNRLNRILLATDFSEASENALDHATLIAAKNDAALQVLHVQALLTAETPDPSKTFPEAERYQEVLDRFAASGLEAVKPKFEVPVTKVTRRAPSATPAILEYAKEAGIDLIVMGTHGRKRAAHVLLGSVAEQVVRLSPVSVLVAGRGEGHHVDRAGYRSILVPIDFSEQSLVALAQAVQIAEQHKAKLLVMHVVEIVPSPYYYPSYSPLEAFPDLRRRASEALDRTLRMQVPDALKAEKVLEEGNAAKRIVQVARERHADLVVMATAGLGGVDKLLLGSVAAKVLRTTPCPVLIAKSRDAANV